MARARVKTWSGRDQGVDRRSLYRVRRRKYLNLLIFCFAKLILDFFDLFYFILFRFIQALFSPKLTRLIDTFGT